MLMGSGYLAKAAGFFIEEVLGVYILLLMLRVLLQWQGANFYNPVSQFLVRISDPLVQPLQYFVGHYKKINGAAVLLLVGLKFIQISLLMLLSGGHVAVLGCVAYAMAGLLHLALKVFLFAILLRVLLTWLNPRSHHLFIELLDTLSEPLLDFSRRWIKPVNGMDLSPLVAIIGLQLAVILVVTPIADLARHLM